MIETRRNAAVATAERLAKASSGNKGSRGFSPYMELEHAPYERTFMDYKIAAPSLTRFENRFYISAPTCLKRRKKEGGGERREEKRNETRRKKGRKKKGKRRGKKKKKRRGTNPAGSRSRGSTLTRERSECARSRNPEV